MNLSSTTQQRQQDKEKGDFGKTIVLFILILLLVWLMTGCATVLEKSVATCYALDGSPAWTKAEGVEKFACDRPAVVTTRAAR